MLYLLTAVFATPVTGSAPQSGLSDCRPSLILMSATDTAPARRNAPAPRRPRPCMTPANA